MSIVARVPAPGHPQNTRLVATPDGETWLATLVVGKVVRTVEESHPGRWLVLEPLEHTVAEPVYVDVDGYARASIVRPVPARILALAATAIDEFVALGHLGSSDRGTEALEEAGE